MPTSPLLPSQNKTISEAQNTKISKGPRQGRFQQVYNYTDDESTETFVQNNASFNKYLSKFNNPGKYETGADFVNDSSRTANTEDTAHQYK